MKSAILLRKGIEKKGLNPHRISQLCLEKYNIKIDPKTLRDSWIPGTHIPRTIDEASAIANIVWNSKKDCDAYISSWKSDSSTQTVRSLRRAKNVSVAKKHGFDAIVTIGALMSMNTHEYDRRLKEGKTDQNSSDLDYKLANIQAHVLIRHNQHTIVQIDENCAIYEPSELFSFKNGKSNCCTSIDFKDLFIEKLSLFCRGIDSKPRVTPAILFELARSAVKTDRKLSPSTYGDGEYSLVHKNQLQMWLNQIDDAKKMLREKRDIIQALDIMSLVTSGLQTKNELYKFCAKVRESLMNQINTLSNFFNC